MTHDLFVHAVGVAGPGLDGWDQTVRVLTGTEAYVPVPLSRHTPELLPPTERRRASASTRLAFSVAEQALQASDINPADLTAVFASACGDTDIVHQICEALTEPEPERAVSPTRFHNSVHNAPVGYWNIATACPQPATSIAANDATFGAGLMAAIAQAISEQVPVLLVVYDLPFPEPLTAKRPMNAPFGAALIISTSPSAAAARFSFETVAAGTATGFSEPELELLRLGNPAARSLPFLSAIAAMKTTSVAVELPDGILSVVVTPCA